MKRRTATVCIAIACLVAPLSADPLPVAKPETVGLSSQRLERIGQVLRSDIDSGRMPGAVVAIARKGKLVYYEAFGFIDKTVGLAMSKDAIFSIASMTKPLVSVGALMLVEENRLLLNDPVGKYLPGLDNMSVSIIRSDPSGNTTFSTEPARRKPTLQDLMRHTAGVTNGSEANEVSRRYLGLLGESVTGAEFIDKLGKLPLQYQPGTKWGYSLGFDVLGVVIEAVTKQSLGQYLNERVFKPLNMVDTGFSISADKNKRYAKPLQTDPDTCVAQTARDTRARKLDCGGGCAFSTAADYLRFAQMLLDEGKLDGTRLLGRKTVEYMSADQLGPEVDIEALRNYPNINGYGFGLGVAVRRGAGIPGVMGSAGDFHWGGANGTYFWVDPKEELAVVFMAATPGAARLHYRQVITTLVLQAISD